MDPAAGQAAVDICMVLGALSMGGALAIYLGTVFGIRPRRSDRMGELLRLGGTVRRIR